MESLKELTQNESMHDSEENKIEHTKPATTDESTSLRPLSKNQQKKLKKIAQFKKKKQLRRINERQRQKLKRQEAIANGLPARNGPSRKALKKLEQITDENRYVLQVAIDLDFDDLMSDHDIAKCVKQCLRIYTINRRSPCPLQIHFTGIKQGGRVHAGFEKNDGWENWRLHYHFNKSYNDIFPQDKLVYLTSDSDNVLHKLETSNVYVIGGLVDHNHHKGVCHERANNLTLKTARLPLSEFVDMKTREVLSTFHVFEILMRVSEGKSWTDAILGTLPARKGAKAKNDSKEIEYAVDVEDTRKQPNEAKDEHNKFDNT